MHYEHCVKLFVTGRGRHRAGVQHYPSATSFAGARAHHAPAYGHAEEEEEPAAEQPVEDEPQDEEQPEQDEAAEPEDEPTPVRPHKPAYRARARPQRPAAPETHQGGVTAIANSESHGDGAKSHSRAAAYGGRYTGGRFGQ
jgi:outer membrane biosynthesis protein TonB